MDIFRTVLSALFAIGGVAEFFFGWVNEGILFWFVAAVILPYVSANKFTNVCAAIAAGIGAIRFIGSGLTDYYPLIMCGAISVDENGTGDGIAFMVTASENLDDKKVAAAAVNAYKKA